MARDYKDVRIRCPFFARQDSNRLHCESPLKNTKQTSVMLYFASNSLKEEHRETFCEADYEQCPLCRVAMQKYE